MNNEKENIEIPFGAFDSELGGWEYTIPEDFEALIEDGKVIVRKAESEDEKIRKRLISYFKSQLEARKDDSPEVLCTYNKWIDWLEKQGEQKPVGFNIGDENRSEWSEEDKELMKWSINNLTELKDRFGEEYGKVGDCINWLKSLKDRVQPQSQWKPSEENIKDLEWCAELVKDNLGTPFHRIMVFIDELKKLKDGK